MYLDSTAVHGVRGKGLKLHLLKQARFFKHLIVV